MLTLKGRELSSLAGKEQSNDDVSKLDISNNLFTDLEGIEAWQDNLKWLNGSHNQIKSIKHLKSCTKLNVLNLGHNKLTNTKHLNKLKELNALILNDNELESVDGLTALKELNTLVVSSNKLESVDVTSLKKLQKFSISHNKLKEFPFIQTLKDIKDLKLNGNMIEQIPDWVVSSCIRIKILDLGNNNLRNLQTIECLCKLPYLENLNLRGNPLCDVEDYYLKMKEKFPNLKILDYKKMADLYFKAIEHKSKKEQMTSSEKCTESNEKSNDDSPTEESNDVASQQPICSNANRGFKSDKLKSNMDVSKIDLNDDRMENDGPKNDTGSLKGNSSNLKERKKKKKKRKLLTNDCEDKVLSVKRKKNSADEKLNTMPTKQLVNKLEENFDSKIIKKEKKKKKVSKSKEETKKSGIVSIKAIAVKSNNFSHDDLQTALTSFGSGKSCAWS